MTRSFLGAFLFLFWVLPGFSQTVTTSTSWECVCEQCEPLCGDGDEFGADCCDRLACPDEVNPVPASADARGIARGTSPCFDLEPLEECRGYLVQTGLPATCTPVNEKFGSGCHRNSTYSISRVNQSSCVSDPDDPAGLCIDEDMNTVDSASNRLAWGEAYTEADAPSSAWSSGMEVSAPSFGVGEKRAVARVVVSNEINRSGTGVGHAKLRLTTETAGFALTDCDEDALNSIVLDAFIYNTVNDTGDPALDADFVCFPSLGMGAGDPPPCLDDGTCPDCLITDTCPKCIEVDEGATSSFNGAFIEAIVVPDVGKSQFRVQGGGDPRLRASLFQVGSPFGQARVTRFVHAPIDVFPHRCPNSLQLLQIEPDSPPPESVIEVVVFGHDDLDVLEIDPARVWGRKPGNGLPEPPLEILYEDVGAATEKIEVCECGELPPDGRLDMILRFPAAPWLEALQNSVDLEIEFGVAMRTIDGDAIESADCLGLGACSSDDNVAPSVSLAEPLRFEQLPLHVEFSADDDDGFAGTIVAERVFLDDCLILDGEQTGNRDGVLTDDEVSIEPAMLCEAAAACGVKFFRQPVLTVEAEDCVGNTGSAQLQLHSTFFVNEKFCETDECDCEIECENDDDSESESDDSESCSSSSGSSGSSGSGGSGKSSGRGHRR